ncbi:MAG TPA: GNAT family N-acetyltransferase, partial [Candidatus Baltobacteraceae bacterium]
MLAIQRVNAAAFAQEAAHILEEAWPPPALHYTREYLRWQMTFPSDVDAIGVAAMDGREPVGFIGASPRRMRSGGESFTCFIVSFVAVRPKWRNRRVASALYAALLHEIRAARIATITFALPQSTGERLLLREYANGGFAIIPLGAYHTYAYRARGEDNSQYDVFTSEDPRLLCEAIAYCS